MENKGEFSGMVNGLITNPIPIISLNDAFYKLKKQEAIKKLNYGIVIPVISNIPIKFNTNRLNVRKGSCYHKDVKERPCGSSNAVLFPVSKTFMPNNNDDLSIAVCPDCRNMKPFGKYYRYMVKQWVIKEEERKLKEYLASLCPCGCGRIKKTKWAGQRCKQRFDVLDSIVRGVGPTEGELTIQLNHTRKCLEVLKVRESKFNNTTSNK